MAERAGRAKPAGKAKRSVSRKLTAEVLRNELKSIAAAGEGSSLLAALAAQQLGHVWLFVGEEHLRVKRMVGWIRETFFAEDQAAVSSCFGTELGTAAAAAHIRATLASMSLFAKQQLLVIYEADKVKAAAADAVAAALPQARTHTLVILVADALSERAPLLSRAKEALVVEFSALTGSTLERWMQKEAQQHGAGGVSADAAQVLIKSYGSDLDVLSQEIAKLSLLIAPGEKIGLAHAAQLARRTSAAQGFDLVEQMARRNVIAASAIARDLIGQGMHPLQISSFLSRALRTLLAQQQPPGSGPIASELANGWFLKNLGTSGRLFAAGELSRSLEVLCDLDFQLKDSKLPDLLALLLAVEKIALRRFAT